MKGVEKQVLHIIKKLEEADRELLGSKIGVSTEYAAQVCSVLIKDGYVKEEPDCRLKLTSKGKEFTGPVVQARKPFIKW